MTVIAVVGATGFVGTAVSQALVELGVDVVSVKAPRLRRPRVAFSAADGQGVLAERHEEIRNLAAQLASTAAVVNCAGNPDASSRYEDALFLANAELVAVLGAACNQAGVKRLVHVSSAVVQGRRPILDDTQGYDRFSAYSRSKILGEELLLAVRPIGSIIYRPPSVHAHGRRVTRMIARIADSPLASVAAPGNSPTPQALLENVADAIAFLATCVQYPPSIVSHPWEGLTTTSLLRTLGGRDPLILPRPLAKVAILLAYGLAAILPDALANTRRVEMIWFGQAQAESWLTSVGWEPLKQWADSSLGRQ